MEPALADAVAGLVKSGHTRITVAPLFMAQGGHLKNDLPKILDAIRAEHRGTEIALLPAIGEVDAILVAISDWLVSAAAN
jgi:sirohydrochlorin cobaltochelatase